MPTSVFLLYTPEEKVSMMDPIIMEESHIDNSLVSTSSIPMKLLVYGSPYNLSDNVYY